MSDGKHDSRIRQIYNRIEKKDEAPKASKNDTSLFKKFDNDKEDWSLMPDNAMTEILKVLQHGASKYGKRNWIENADGVEYTRYINALERHLKSYKAGNDYDNDSKLLELAHMGANIIFLLTYHLEGIGIDNRDYRLGKVINNIRCDYLVKVDGSHRYYSFTCLHCDSTFTTTYNNVQKGNTKSCGCQKYTNRPHTHNMSNSPIYNRWRSMISRCEDDTQISYPNYGGRGIKVCDSWHTFENFISDMGVPPSGDYQLDRIDNDGDYEVENCEWVPRQVNIRKQKRVHKYSINGTDYTLKELSDKYNINLVCLRKRIKMGWDLMEAVTTKSAKVEQDSEAKRLQDLLERENSDVQETNK